jgi:adenylosuccinate synthase
MRYGAIPAKAKSLRIWPDANSRRCVRAGIGTNAGHSVYLAAGQQPIRTRQLPMGFLHPTTRVAVGSGVAVDPDILIDEIQRYDLADRVWIDNRCPIITASRQAL